MPIEILAPEVLMKALGDPTRLKILRFLCACAQSLEVDESGAVHREGPTGSEICCHITGENKINSTISHHLHELHDAGLIHIQREGKNMICTPDYEMIKELAAFLSSLTESQKEDCC